MTRLPACTGDTPPRAPTQAEWDALTPIERAAVVAALPNWLTAEEELGMSSGDAHRDACMAAGETLKEFFGHRRSGVYVGVDLLVYYPGSRRFVPDLFVVLDVEPGPRTTWVVSQEGKGLDFVLEVHFLGDAAKDLKGNVAFYASLGIPEYFVYDLRHRRLHGWRLPSPGADRYVPILAQHGRYTSEVLGLDLLVEADALRFYQANARLQSPKELFGLLQHAVDEISARLEDEQRLREDEQRLREDEQRLREEEQRLREEEQRLREEEQRLREEEQRLREEEQRARADAERRLAEALALIEQLKRG